MYTRRPRALVAALTLLGSLTLSAGCGGSDSGPNVDVTNDIDVKCDVDSSASSATAYPGTALND
jgi:hypothetical protein